MEAVTKVCGECGEENNIIQKEPKQYNPKAILFICRSCRVRNLRDGTVLPLEKLKALPEIQAQEKPKVKPRENLVKSGSGDSAKSLEKPEENSKPGAILSIFGALIIGVIAVILHKKLQKPQGTDSGKPGSTQINPFGPIK
ncbi:MAG: hypothetical protein NT014_00080 [Candidatus Omnitrophica bacterium]|nr:hypothetical protein [Candidatus Omnitrophota bacterium]